MLKKLSAMAAMILMTVFSALPIVMAQGFAEEDAIAIDAIEADDLAVVTDSGAEPETGVELAATDDPPPPPPAPSEDESPAVKSMSPAMQELIQKSVSEGQIPPKEVMSRLPANIREEIVKEIMRQLKAKQTKKTTDAESPKEGKGFTNFLSEYWVQFLALVVSLIGVGLAVTGFTFAAAKRKKSVSKFITEIDDAFQSFKWKSKRCEAELYRLQDLVEDQLKDGKIDESAYHLLLNRIDKYMREINELDGIPEADKKKKIGGNA